MRLGLGYFYPRGSVGPVCLVEAALEFLAMYTRHVTKSVGLRPRFLPGCCPLTTIHQLNEATGKQEDTIDLRLGICPYYLGRALRSQVYGSQGEDLVSSSLGELYQMSGASPYPVTKEDIYQVFLPNIAAGKQDEFRNLYCLLHGGSIPGPWYRVSSSAHLSASPFFLLPSRRSGTEREENHCT